MKQDNDNWYWSIIELKNHSLIESFDLNARSPDIISFLEECFNRVKALIESIKNNELQ
jgi:hypothetical protein